jgi:hypothetical protein
MPWGLERKTIATHPQHMHKFCFGVDPTNDKNEINIYWEGVEVFNI